MLEYALVYINCGLARTGKRNWRRISELLLSLLSSKASLDTASAIILRETDSTAAGSTEEFLSSRLRFTKDDHDQDICLVKVGDEEIGVMMGWEKGIMEKTVEKLCDGHENGHELKVLNIGFGLGIVRPLFSLYCSLLKSLRLTAFFNHFRRHLLSMLLLKPTLTS